MIRNILLVDDDHDDSDMFLEALQEIDAEIKCLFATNGKEVIRKLHTAGAKPQVIFLDIITASSDSDLKRTLLELQSSTSHAVYTG